MKELELRDKEGEHWEEGQIRGGWTCESGRIRRRNGDQIKWHGCQCHHTTAPNVGQGAIQVLCSITSFSWEFDTPS